MAIDRTLISSKVITSVPGWKSETLGEFARSFHEHVTPSFEQGIKKRVAGKVLDAREEEIVLRSDAKSKDIDVHMTAKPAVVPLIIAAYVCIFAKEIFRQHCFFFPSFSPCRPSPLPTYPRHRFHSGKMASRRLMIAS